MNFNIFIVFHNEIADHFYNINTNDWRYLTFYGVDKKFDTSRNVLYEKSLKIYNPALQNKKYNEGSALYHIYMNDLYKSYDYVGFAQYDMIFNKETISNIRKRIESKNKAHQYIFYIGFFEWAFLGGQTTIISDYGILKNGLDSYNSFFKTSYTKEDLIKNKMIICNTFIIPSNMFKKMMDWMQQYFKNHIESNMIDTENFIEFNPGHMIEALTGMFLSLEVASGVAKYVNFDICHSMYHL
jgi:hypothetical protein